MMKKLYFLLIILFVCSFSKKQYNKYKGFGAKEIEKSLVLISKGNFSCSSCESGMHSQKPLNSRYAVDSFYICNHEVSNGEYLGFINDIHVRDTVLFKKMLPDTSVWTMENLKNEPMKLYYFRHPAYFHYPVVGVTHEQAERYCEWLTEKYMQSAKRKYRSVRFRLPEKVQWVYAAGGDKKTFPVGFFLQNNKGQWLANFRVFSQGGIQKVTLPVKFEGDTLQRKHYFIANPGLNIYTELSDPNTGYFITTPVISYYPDKKGIYNMAGNVEEFVREKGYTRGGSWNDPGYYLQNMAEEIHDSAFSASAERGFRYVMEIVK